MKTTARMYVCLDVGEVPIYVGVSQNVPQRLAVHRRESPWFSEVAHVSRTEPMLREHAEQLEAQYVIALRPKFNRTPEGKGGRPEQPAPPCGTVKAYRRHVRRGEEIDVACKAAWAEYHKERRNKP